MAPLNGTPLRIVLLGKVGTGKSSTGNTILGRNVFHEDVGFDPVTSVSSRESTTFAGRRITVVDTPGVFDLTRTEEELRREIGACVELSLPGPHVFLLVIRLGRFTPEERNAVEWIQTHFGQEATQFTMVLFTHGDILQGRSVESLFNNEIRDLVGCCGGGYHVFNNAERDDRTQVEELVRKIDAMVQRNGGQHFTSEMYQAAQMQTTITGVIRAVAGGVGGGVGGGAGGAVGGAIVGAIGGFVTGGIASTLTGAARGAKVGAAVGAPSGAVIGIIGGYNHGAEFGGAVGGKAGGKLGTCAAGIDRIIPKDKDKTCVEIGTDKVHGTTLAYTSEGTAINGIEAETGGGVLNTAISVIQLPATIAGVVGECAGKHTARFVEDVYQGS